MSADKTVITISQLKFHWPQTQEMVLNIEKFSVTQGQHIFIKGESGSGKSTLLNLIGGVLLPQEGDISLLNHSLNQLSGSKRDNFRADHIGFIFQMFNLLPYLSVIENVLLPLHFSKKRKHKVQSKSKLNDEAERLLKHLDLSGELLKRSVTQLSVGQQQRVAAARALIGMPEIIIADEPTSSLDSQRRKYFIELLIQECNQANSTLVFVSHDQYLEDFFDQTIELNDINHMREMV